MSEPSQTAGPRRSAPTRSGSNLSVQSLLEENRKLKQRLFQAEKSIANLLKEKETLKRELHVANKQILHHKQAASHAATGKNPSVVVKDDRKASKVASYISREVKMFEELIGKAGATIIPTPVGLRKVKTNEITTRDGVQVAVSASLRRETVDHDQRTASVSRSSVAAETSAIKPTSNEEKASETADAERKAAEEAALAKEAEQQAQQAAAEEAERQKQAEEEAKQKAAAEKAAREAEEEAAKAARLAEEQVAKAKAEEEAAKIKAAEEAAAKAKADAEAAKAEAEAAKAEAEAAKAEAEAARAEAEAARAEVEAAKAKKAAEDSLPATTTVVESPEDEKPTEPQQETAKPEDTAKPDAEKLMPIVAANKRRSIIVVTESLDDDVPPDTGDEKDDHVTQLQLSPAAALISKPDSELRRLSARMDSDFSTQVQEFIQSTVELDNDETSSDEEVEEEEEEEEEEMEEEAMTEEEEAMLKIAEELREAQEALPILMALLEKQSPRGFKPWQRRFVSVYDYNIYYSKSPIAAEDIEHSSDREHPIHCLPLVVVNQILAPSGKREFKIQAQDPKSGQLRNYKFRCPSIENRDAWVQGLNDHKNHLLSMLRWVSLNKSSAVQVSWN